MRTPCDPPALRSRLLVLGLVVTLGALVLPAAASAKPRAHKPTKPPLGVGFVKPPTLIEGTQSTVAVAS